MVRTIHAISLVALIIVTAGCTMCAHWLDYCGPTFTGECGQQCAPNARAGSIFAPRAEVVGGPGMEMETEMEMVPGTVISVTDAKAQPGWRTTRR